MYVCVCVREREREGESVCSVCMCSVYMYIGTFIQVSVIHSIVYYTRGGGTMAGVFVLYDYLSSAGYTHLFNICNNEKLGVA